jgi:hypothetical protein
MERACWSPRRSMSSTHLAIGPAGIRDGVAPRRKQGPEEGRLKVNVHNVCNERGMTMNKHAISAQWYAAEALLRSIWRTLSRALPENPLLKLKLRDHYAEGRIKS